MSFLSSILGGIESNGASGIMGLVTQILQKVGGIQGLQQLLADQGLGDKMSSWVGSTDNQPVSGQELGQALQQGGLGDLISQAASQMGVGTDTVHAQLADILPDAINCLTPDGQAPNDDGADLDLSALAGLAGKFLGGGGD